jgi:hypothetical protein
MLPKMLASDICENINRHATLIDPNENQFDILVKKKLMAISI